jgi:ribosomal protein S18 acetylase RimI-like enzyme
MSGALAIRRAASPDAAALSAIGRETFVLTFGHLYAPEDLAAFLDDSHSVASYAALLDDPRYGLWLLEEEGVGGRKRVVGFAVAGPCGLPHPDVAPADGELKRLYLLPEIQNGGWGGKLFDTAIDWLQREGRHRIWISVWSENFGAQRFYARHGFGKVAEYEFPVGRHRDIEFMYRRDPAGGAGTR